MNFRVLPLYWGSTLKFIQLSRVDVYKRQDQGGIDPTLLFDGEDVYFASTSRDEDDRDGIFMCKINPYTGEKLSESVCISHGLSLIHI